MKATSERKEWSKEGFLPAALLVCALILAGAPAHSAPKMKMSTDIPPEITTPDSVETRLGTLRFFDGFPDNATVETVFENLDFSRGVKAFLTTMPAASMYAGREALYGLGATNGTVAVFEDLMDSKSLWLTANTESIYFATWLDTKNGPLVIEPPPGVTTVLDDFWGRCFASVSPDQGSASRYLLLPPGYTGPVPHRGYSLVQSPTYGVWFAGQGSLVNGEPRQGAENIKARLRIYPFAQVSSPPRTKFVNASGNAHNTIFPNDYSFFEQVNHVVQEESNASTDPETLGLLASIGIEKGKPFEPDARMKKILTEAAQLGNATARTLTFKTRLSEVHPYTNSAWISPFGSGTRNFLQNGARNLDARTMFCYQATDLTLPNAIRLIAQGSQYLVTFVDAQGKPFDGTKAYTLRLPGNIPARNGWSLALYDNQTRSLLQTDAQFPSINSRQKGLVINSDKSVDLYFSPQAPPGQENNWAQTVPGKGWNVILRLYAPLMPFYRKTWQPGEFELVK